LSLSNSWQSKNESAKSERKSAVFSLSSNIDVNMAKKVSVVLLKLSKEILMKYPSLMELEILPTRQAFFLPHYF